MRYVLETSGSERSERDCWCWAGCVKGKEFESVQQQGSERCCVLCVVDCDGLVCCVEEIEVIGNVFVNVV